MSKVGLIFGGRSVEHLVSVASARTVRKGLKEAGHHVVPIGIGQDGGWVAPSLGEAALAGDLDFLEGVGAPVSQTLRSLLEADIEVLFPIIHGTWGEDGSMQGFCEIIDLPYVGAGVMASAVAMNKAICKRVLSSRGLPVVDSVVLLEEDQKEIVKSLAPLDAIKQSRDELAFPLFIKPSSGGSSVGIRRVERFGELRDALSHAFRFDSTVIIERAIDGRELECAVLGYKTLEASVVGEIVPGKEFYDYADKYLEDGAQLLAPAHLPSDVADELRLLATQAFAAIGGTGMARVDFFLEGEDHLLVNEINTLPGFTEISMYPRLWELSGVPLAELVDRLVTIAIERHEDRCELDEGIKAWIREITKG